MTQHSTRAASLLPSNSRRNRLLGRSWPVRLVLVAAPLLAVPFLFHAGSTVHATDKEITGVTLTSPNPGELSISWDTPATRRTTTASHGRSPAPSGLHSRDSAPAMTEEPTPSPGISHSG